MRLKRREEVECRDLDRVESPQFARYLVEQAINTEGLSRIEGLKDVLTDDLDPQRHVWDHHSQARLLEKVENAEIFLIHSLASQPVAPAVRGGLGKDETWKPDDALSHGARFNVEWMLSYATLSCGIQMPIQAPKLPPKEAPQEQPAKEESGRRVVSAKFEKTEVQCGDEVKLEASTENIPDGVQVRFEIKGTRDSKIAAALKVPVSNEKAEGTWVAKKQTDVWDGTPEVFAMASASGKQVETENKITLKEYADIAKETKDYRLTSGRFGWKAKYDMRLEARALYIDIKIKLLNRVGPRPAAGSTDPLPEVGPPVSDSDKNDMRNAIEQILSERWVLHREKCKRGDSCSCKASRGCCKIPVRVEVHFVESGEYHEVNLWEGQRGANAANWHRQPLRDNTYAHETGHLLGWYDEYATGATGPAPRWQPVRADAVMEKGLVVPKEYYFDFRDWLADKTGEKWVLIEK